MDDVDFKVKVTREQLETMCEDIFEKIGAVVEEALRSSEMTMVGFNFHISESPDNVIVKLGPYADIRTVVLLLNQN